MIDTHSHLLPWVDHGCPDMDTCVLMAGAAAASGISTVVCTPHLPEWDPALIQRAGEIIEEVRGALASAGVQLRLLLGFEVDVAVAATVDTERARSLAIEGSPGAILLEMPYVGWPVYMEETIFRLSTAGFVPVLAHPERNDRVHKSSELLEGCIKAGAVAQATAGSLGGEFGRASMRAFYRLLAEGSIQLLASDAHAHRRENWTMASMLASLEGMVAPRDVVRLTETNPSRLLAGDKLVASASTANGTSWRRARRRQSR
ncbi:MAG: hypothetical protein A2133_07135 [Actinobacteria bacterium RBG_16_64_13]|nr:MAG: hypothetical protein A2133_07135 [Actinobacteria bacterium RBG_16_64_13]